MKNKKRINYLKINKKNKIENDTYETKDQINSILQSLIIFKYIPFLFPVVIFLLIFEFLMIYFFNFDNFQKYLYPIYTFIIGILILKIINFNYKILIFLGSLFGIFKYIFYYLEDIYKIYSQLLI